MSGHTSGNRVNGVFHRNALLLQHIGHFAKDMLRLRNRHAVTGYNDDAFRLLHHIGSILGGTALPWALFFGRTTGGGCLCTKAARDNADEAAVHGLAHDVRQNRARRAHQSAGDDHRCIVQREAHGRGCPARIAVEHRYHDGHVRAADWNDKQEADHECECRNRPEYPWALINREIGDETQDRGQRAQIDHMPHRQHDRRTGHFAREFKERNYRTRERDCTNGNTKAHFNATDGVNQTVLAIDAKCFRVQERGCGNKHCGHADKAVKRGNQLRHIRHRNLACGHPTDAATDKDCAQNFGQ